MATQAPPPTQPSDDEESSSRFSPIPLPDEVMDKLDEFEAKAIAATQKEVEPGSTNQQQTERQHGDGASVIPPSPPKKRKGTDVSSTMHQYLTSYKILSPATYLKNIKVESDDVLDLISSPPATLSLKIVAGGLFCLIYCNKWGSNDEGFPFPFGPTTLTSTLTKKDSNEFKFIQETGIVAVAARRHSKEHNKPLLKQVGKYEGTFKQVVFISVLQENTKEMKKILLNTVEAVSSKSCYFCIDVNKVSDETFRLYHST